MVKSILGTLMILLGVAVAGLAALYSAETDGGWRSTCSTYQSSDVPTQDCTYDGNTMSENQISRLIVGLIGIGFIVGGSTVIAGAGGRSASVRMPADGWSPPPTHAAPPPPPAPRS